MLKLNDKVYIASAQQIKVNAAAAVFERVITLSTISGVPEQPIGITEIKTGVYNRLDNCINVLPVIAFETGIIGDIDCTCCVLRTSFGDFEKWVYHKIRNIKALARFQRSVDVTFGKFAYAENANDWYLADGGAKSREKLLTNATQYLFNRYSAVVRSMPRAVIPAPLLEFKGVKFMDIQYPLIHHANELTETVYRLSNGLLFNKVMVLDARGFLLAGEFMRKKYPIILARKPGKLPAREITVEYKKEYGVDSICIEEGTIKQGDRVLIVDDVIATGGTMRAAAELVKKSKGAVAAFVAPYAIVDDNNDLICGDLTNMIRFLCTQKQAYIALDNNYANPKIPVSLTKAPLNIIYPPSLYSHDVNDAAIPMKWGRFARSSNIWFNPVDIKGNRILVFMDPANEAESFDVLQMLSILHRKDPKEVIVVIPFLEQATQDRVEYDGDGWESLATVDTIAKLLGTNKVLTFDLHAEQSRFAFHDLRYDSLVEALLNNYKTINPNTVVVFPDEGAAKRYGKLVKDSYVTFKKVRKDTARIVVTDDIISEKHYVIVDDLVRSGGTMHEVAKKILSSGGLSVDALFAHAPLEPAAAKNMTIFRDVWTTDTCINEVPRGWVKLCVYDYLVSKFSDGDS